MIDSSPNQVDMFVGNDETEVSEAPPQRPGSLFGSKVRELRERHGLAQRQLAERLGVSPAYLSQLESGKKGRPSDRLIHAICHQFGLIWDDADDLFLLADSSRRVVKIDTTKLDAHKTEAAKLFAEKLSGLSNKQLNQLMSVLEGRQNA